MSRALALTIVAFAIVATLLAGPAAAQEDGNLAGITYWTINDGATEDFEAGLKAHNQYHAKIGDPVPILTWQAISGPHEGKYGRGSFGHSWADFDQDPAALQADTADSAKTITPHIASAESSTWQFMPDLSNPRGTPGTVTRIIEFRVNPGQMETFEGAIGKIHAALSNQEGWPHYEWYALVDGGYVPTYAVVLPRDNFAGFAPGDVSFMEAVAAEHGEMAGEIFESLGAATKSQINYTLVARPDLSYWPSEGE
jgi:hypothetical protein